MPKGNASMQATATRKKSRSCAMRRTTATCSRSLPKATLEARDEALRIAYDESVPGARTRLEILRLLHS
jgi:hypothetical protein